MYTLYCVYVYNHYSHTCAHAHTHTHTHSAETEALRFVANINNFTLIEMVQNNTVTVTHTNEVNLEHRITQNGWCYSLVQSLHYLFGYCYNVQLLSHVL